MVSSATRKWWALALLSVVQFMVVLDIAIVNVALPSIQADLGFSQENLQWVISAYALVFGGFLLLGGRTADILGRRRVFIGGLAVFSVGSLLAGFAWSEASLIGARGVQGLGAAIISPAALSILMTTFREGRERNVALGVWGAVGGFGAAAGVLLGGIFTDALSWEWIFFVNVPVGVGARSHSRPSCSASRATAAPRASTRSVRCSSPAGSRRPSSGSRRRTTTAGARRRHSASSPARSRCSPRSSSSSCRAKHPLMSFSIFKIKTVSGANVAGFILGTSLFSMFLMLTLYMQEVLGYSAMKTGVAYLSVALTSIVWAGVASQLVTKIGVKPVLVTGMSLVTVAYLYFTQVSVGGSYLGDLLPGFLIIGAGISFAFVPISIAALAGVEAKDAGLASGLINTSQQIGGALGIALLSTIAVSHTTSASHAGKAVPVALTDGFQAAFWVGAAIAAIGVVASVVLVRRDELAQAPQVEAEALPMAA